MASSNQSRILYHDKFDSEGFTNENTLARGLLSKPDQLNPALTFLQGKNDKMFPLTFLTEGQKGGVSSIEINDVQYTYNVIGRMKQSDYVISAPYSGADKPGIGFSLVTVNFATGWLKHQHNIVSPSGVVCRIMYKPNDIGTNYKQYKLVIVSSDDQAFIPVADLAAGARWAMEGGANVTESLSMGNESNVMTPSKMKNQISFLRKSYRWAGNVANKTVEVVFNLPSGQTSYWMPFERWQHMLQFKQAVEENLWYSIYNRRADGTITMKDPENGLPIPYGAGLVDQIPNQDTYAVLTANKIKNTVGDIFYGVPDTTKMDVILYTGTGGRREFDDAMKEEAKNFTQITGDKFVRGAGRNLVLGGFFAQYEHVDGHVVTVKPLNLLDYGARAEVAARHPKTGLPITSYDMYFVDNTTYDGVRNIRMITQKGRSMLTGIVKGISPAPKDLYVSNDMEILSTEQDVCSVHYFCAKGVALNRNTTSFVLKCNLS